MDLKELLGEAYKEGMTFEEAEAALRNVTPPDNGAGEVTKLKTALSKANAEAAEYKKQLRAKQTDDEAAAAAQKEEHERLMKENADLKRSATVSEKKAKFLALGYDDQLAESTAAALVDGDMETVITNQSKFLEVQKKDLFADKMKKTPRPGAGAEGSGAVDYQKLAQEAQANGDYSIAAYYTRLAAENDAAQAG